MLGIIIPTDFHIFQMGWNHQPVMIRERERWWRPSGSQSVVFMCRTPKFVRWNFWSLVATFTLKMELSLFLLSSFVAGKCIYSHHILSYNIISYHILSYSSRVSVYICLHDVSQIRPSTLLTASMASLASWLKVLGGWWWLDNLDNDECSNLAYNHRGTMWKLDVQLCWIRFRATFKLTFVYYLFVFTLFRHSYVCFLDELCSNTLKLFLSLAKYCENTTWSYIFQTYVNSQ